MPSNPSNRTGFGNPSAVWTPADLGYEAWTGDNALCNANVPLTTAGRLQAVKLWLPGVIPINNILCQVTTGGTLTASQCFACVYDGGRNLVAITGDQSGVWNGTGQFTMPVATGTGLPNLCDTPIAYVGFWFNGGGAPQFRGFSNPSGGTAASLNGILPVLQQRAVLADTGLTTQGTAPAQFTPANSSTGLIWAAIT